MKYFIFLIFFFSFFPQIFSDIGLRLSVNSDSSTDFDSLSSSSSDSSHEPGLHWNGFSGAFLKSIFQPNSVSNYHSNNYGYNNGYQYPRQYLPIYGNTGYTNGQINGVQTVNTGHYTTNYNGYSNNYWICVNNYRGQYYYSYTYGNYVCDTRANRYGK